MAIFMSSLYEKRMNGESVRSLIVLILDQYLKIMQITLKRIDNRRLKTDKIDVDKALNWVQSIYSHIIINTNMFCIITSSIVVD